MSVATLLQRQEAYLVSTYRKALGGKDAYGQQVIEWAALATNVPFDLHLGPGRLSQEPVGEMATGNYPAFGNHLVGLKQGDGIQIDTALDPTEVGRKFVVERCKDFGPRGGWQGEVSETDEDFTAGAS